MKQMLIAALAAASMTLASCATMPTAAQVAPQIERAQSAYDRIADAVDLVLPYLSLERAARVRLAMALAERGLLAARLASTAAEQLAALKQAEAATATIESTAGSWRRLVAGQRLPCCHGQLAERGLPGRARIPPRYRRLDARDPTIP